MFGWLFGAAAEARSLNRDSRSILGFTREGYSSERQGRAALATRRAIAEAHERLAEPDCDPKSVLAHLRSRHRDARRTRHEVHFTAFTLAIIYLRAERLGEPAQPARTAIDQFLADWEHVDDDEFDIEF